MTTDTVRCATCANTGWYGDRDEGPGHRHCFCQRPCSACGAGGAWRPTPNTDAYREQVADLCDWPRVPRRVAIEAIESLCDALDLERGDAEQRWAERNGRILDLSDTLAAYADALRAIAILHAGRHVCGDDPETIWAIERPCPTRVIADATLSGYGRGGPWPYNVGVQR